jgi:hypothetical protein
MNPITLATSSLPALLSIGTTLWARVITQGIEQALLTTAIEGCLSGIRSGVKLLVSAEITRS